MQTVFKALAASAILFGSAVASFAHHGWAWTEDEESRLEGTVVAVSLGNPHAHLEVENAEGLWQVDLAPPNATERAGFVEGVAEPGNPISFTGHRSRDPSQFSFKAETVTVGGKTYDVYPDREKSLEPQAAAAN